MKRILYSLLVAALPFGSVLAEAPKEKNAKVTLVYQHELPNVPGKSIKGVLVEYGPGGYSPGHTHPKSAFIYATVLEGRSAASQRRTGDDLQGRQRTFPRCPGTATASAPMPARRDRPSFLAVFVVDTNETDLDGSHSGTSVPIRSSDHCAAPRFRTSESKDTSNVLI
jgi:hypothetical protein